VSIFREIEIMIGPKLRADLEISPQRDGIIVNDPVRNKFYRFTGASALVSKSLDGLTGIDEIPGILERQAHVKISPAAVNTFLQRLSGIGLLEGTECPAEAPRRHRGDLLNIRLKAINPRTVFDWLLPRTLFLFSAGFLCISSTLMLAAFYVSITRGREIGGSVLQLFTPAALGEFLVIALVIGAVHEFAHGLACEHFGGRVREIGFLLMFFQPCLYCDVSASWMLPKRQRLIVMLAGSFSSSLIWACATLAWRILDPQTTFSHLCVSIILITGLSLFTNFNPLIKLDGYYIFSDLLEMPNLRTRAFGYLRSRIEGQRMDVARRERFMYLLYGTGAALFSLSLLGSVLWFAGGYLISHFQLAGLATVTVLVAAPMAAKQKPDVLDLMATSARMIWKKFRKPARFLALVGAVTGLGMIPWELKVSSPFRILPARELTVVAQIDGQIAAMHVEEGSRLRTGQPIASLANPDQLHDRAKARAELDAARARLAMLRSGSRREEVERLGAAVSRKELELDQARDPETECTRLQAIVERRTTELAYARQNLARSTELFRSGLMPKMTFERDQENAAVQQKQLDEARGDLAVLMESKSRDAQLREKELQETRSQLHLAIAGPRPEEVQAAEAEVRRLEAELAFLEDELRRAIIYSPSDSVVVTPYLKNRLGQFVHRGEMLCKLAVAGARTSVEIAVPEKEAADVAVGYPVAVKLNSYLGRPTLNGRVAFLAPEVDASSGSSFVRAEVQLDGPRDLLKPGMTGFAKIYCGKRSVFQLATRRAMSWVRTEFWTWLP
jgi:multidrug efflux pump subunit AcrA (membrane-fusion protein)